MLRKLIGIGFFLACPFFIAAQIPSPVSFTIESHPKEIVTGQEIIVTVNAEIDEPWHLYSIRIDGEGPIPTTFSSKSASIKLVSKDVSESEAKRLMDPNFGIEVGWHSSFATFTIPITVLNPDLDVITFDVRYMACDDKSCLPPRTVTLSFPANVSGENLVVERISEASSTSAPLADRYDGLWSYVWIALTAGFAALLTPCVFPMIPLTVSFFTKRSDGSRRKAFIQASLFGMSIIGTFTVLGILLSIFIGASGANQFAANPWVNLFIGVIFVVFSFSLLGMFELQLPYQLTNFLNKKSNESQGLLGILFMGLTISAVSFSCTAPFVGGILAATSTGEWFYPVIGMIAFSSSFALPFIFFSMFPTALDNLPKSGQWMNTVKVMLGFIELAAAFKFISNADLVWQWQIVSRPLTLSFWIVLSFLAGIYLLGKLTMPHESKVESVGFGRFISSLPFFAFSVYLLPGIMGASLGIWDAWLPPKQATDVSVIASLNAGMAAGDGVEGWSQDYEATTKLAQQSGKPVLIDFTGYTCTNCRAMESTIFPLKNISERFQNYEKVQLYTDDGTVGPQHQMFQFKLTGTVALPTYAVVDSKTGKLVDMLSGYANEKDFQRFLDNALNKFERQK